MRRAIIGSGVVVLILAGISAVAQAPKRSETPQSPELKVLNRLVGSWQMEAVERQPNGDEKIITGTSIGKWALQGQYLMIRIAGSDRKEDILHLFTFMICEVRHFTLALVVFKLL